MRGWSPVCVRARGFQRVPPLRCIQQPAYAWCRGQRPRPARRYAPSSSGRCRCPGATRGCAGAGVRAAEAVDGIDGQELLAPVAAQQFLARAQLTTTRRPALQPGFVRMTVPVRPDTAVGGALRTGDVVTVLATTDKGKPTAQTRPVLDRVVVDQLGQADTLTNSSSAAPADSAAPSLPLRPNRPVAWVTLLVPEDRASSLALARWTGDVELIQLPGEGSSSRSTP